MLKIGAAGAASVTFVLLILLLTVLRGMGVPLRAVDGLPGGSMLWFLAFAPLVLGACVCERRVVAATRTRWPGPRFGRRALGAWSPESGSTRASRGR